jgi:hypothetical protein
LSISHSPLSNQKYCYFLSWYLLAVIVFKATLAE